MIHESDLEENQRSFAQKVNLENSKRLIGILAATMLISGVQATLYILGDTGFYGWRIIGIKLGLFSLGAILLFPLYQVKNGNAKYVALSQQIVNITVMSMLIMSIVNTFYAQRISSDISIYIMYLFAAAAGVRMKPRLMLIDLVISYGIFVIGISYFQTNSVYCFTHITNGIIMNIIAFLISTMFYHYSNEEYKDKMDIDAKNFELKRISERDELTNLYNHRATNDILGTLIEKAKTTKEEIFLGILDLDNFKEINDRYGHSYGDEVLKQMAYRIMDNIRYEDIAGRYGGDEFIIIFKETTEEQVGTIMNRLLSEVRELNFKECKLSFSCGIAKWNGESKEKLFERADSYMYAVKKSGRNSILVEMKEVVI